MAAFKLTGGNISRSGGAAASGGKSLGNTPLIKVVSRDATEEFGEALLEETLVGTINATAGGGAEQLQGYSYDKVKSDTGGNNVQTKEDEEKINLQAQIDEARIEELRESNEYIDQEYQENKELHEESKQELPPLPDDNPLDKIEEAQVNIAFSDEEDVRTRGAISELEELIQLKQIWSEDMYAAQVTLAESKAQEEQSQAISEGYQARTEAVGSQIDSAKPGLEESQQETGNAAGDLQGQQSNIKQGGQFGGAVGQDASATQNAPETGQNADQGAKDVAEGPGSADQMSALTSQKMAEQQAQAQESQEAQEGSY